MHDIRDWERILFNDLPATFLIEVVLRSTIMFIVLIVAMRMTGKRGVRQLSIFEMVLIIALGSAAGDPMFYEEVGLVPAITVFVCIILLYRFVTWLIGKSSRFETLIEGKPECLVIDGRFSHVKFEKESLAQDEFFMELRLKSVEHLGQIKYAFIEPSGAISIFYFPDKEVKHGLPLLPQVYNSRSALITRAGTYSCAHCGYTVEQEPGLAICAICGHNEWVESMCTTRIA